MKELLSMGLFWLFILAEVFVFYMKRTFSTWSGANQTTPIVMTAVSLVCSIALLVLIVFVFIKVSPWWYGLVMLLGGFIIPAVIPIGKTGETIIAMVGIVGAPLCVVLSFLKLFAVI